MKDTLSIAGRVLYALPMAVFGLFHFMNGQAMAGMVPSWIPGGVFWIYLTGLGLVAAAVSILVKVKASLGAMLLGIMLLIFVLTMHLPGAVGGSQESMTMLLKDAAMAGAAFFIASKS